MRLLSSSDIYTILGLKEPTATPMGLLSIALVAMPPSPLKPAVPLPAIVLMVPAALTNRMRLLPTSAMYRLPAPSTFIPTGAFNSAVVAGPPSPLKAPVIEPVPATIACCAVGGIIGDDTCVQIYFADSGIVDVGKV